jgi:hypothetical protein
VIAKAVSLSAISGVSTSEAGTSQTISIQKQSTGFHHQSKMLSRGYCTSSWPELESVRVVRK